MRNRIGVIIPAFNEAQGITFTLEALQSQWKGRKGLIVVGDNASTDGTAEVVDEFGWRNPEFPLQIVDELEKGTGRAADTAARFVIEKGCDIVARTDADGCPRLDWLDNTTRHMQMENDLALLTGPIRLRKDELYRRGDDSLLATLTGVARMGRTLASRSRIALRVAAGGNLITTAKAYEKVGGFPRISINEGDEDMLFSQAIGVHAEFGPNRMRYARDVVVYTSARRLREMGRLGTLRHYTTGRKKRTGNVDVR